MVIKCYKPATAADFSTLSIETLWPARVRMLLIPYLRRENQSHRDCLIKRGTYRIIVRLSKLKHQLCTLASDGRPIGSSISGWDIPTVSYLNPFLQLGVEGKNLKRRLANKE